MKHNIKVTAILIAMFFITQMIGLAVIWAYEPVVKEVIINGTAQNITISPLPYGMEPPQMQNDSDFWYLLPNIIFSFIIAVLLVFFLMKYKVAQFLRWWFFIVVLMVLGITLNAFFLKTNILQESLNMALLNEIPLSWIICIIIALPLAIYKVFKHNLIVHNLTELLIYPGIAVVFLPLLNIWTIIILLGIISVYDMWAVWHSGFMQKMAKYQMDTLKVFSGFFVPYLTKKQRQLVKEARLSKNKSKFKKKSMKVSLAILGGGDVVFPIITSGVVFRALGLVPAIIVSICATISLFMLFVFAKKGKFYPAMPFISIGCFIGIGLAYMLFYLPLVF